MSDVDIKLFRTQKVQELFDLVQAHQGNEEESQLTADLFALAVLQAEVIGWETSSMVQVVAQQQPLAKKIADKLWQIDNYRPADDEELE